MNLLNVALISYNMNWQGLYLNEIQTCLLKIEADCLNGYWPY